MGFTFSAAVALACTTALLSLAGVWAAVGLAIATGKAWRMRLLACHRFWLPLMLRSCQLAHLLAH